MKKIGKWIDQGKYAKAIKRLNKFAKKDDKNPDVWNLLGFSYRKQGNLEQSAEAYTTALTLDPEHKGALEYQGELFLTLGDMDAAKNNLESLKSLCPSGCHELEELTAAINTAS
jgi:Flp pilus assembly protein TadD